MIRKRIDRQSEGVSVSGELNLVIAAQINEPEEPVDRNENEKQANEEEDS